ncbi:lipoate--protein ligase family protein [Blattabacterium cuenoti]|uniref:hypothetical protein n=1 Tax=Blattabacterium cuenoti TaxID=1653831 RepID=UPI001EEAAEDD|nr:hypothetical protein [Blattabacterium cuenoti]
MKIKKYEKTFSLQKELFNKLQQKKIINCNNDMKVCVGYLLFIEYYKHIFTIGKNGKKNKNLLVSLDFLKKKI